MISNMMFHIIGKLDIFPLMCAADKVLITELTLIHKNIRSVRNSHAEKLTDIENYQCDSKHILMSHKKNQNAGFEDLYIHYH